MRLQRMEHKMPRNKKQKLLYLILFTVAFTASIPALGQNYFQNFREERLQKQLSQLTQSSEYPTISATDTYPQETWEIFEPNILEKYQKLSQQNEDMIGWLKIEGTEIDYPVMYTGDNFYLEHNFKKAGAKNGVPYIDKRCAVEPYGTNTIIYAHNMKNGTMFAELLHYKDRNYYLQHPIIHFDTLYEMQEYEIVAVFESEVFKKSDTVFKHYNFLNAESKASFDEYVADIQALSLHNTDVHPKYGDTFITLMTCSYHTANGRFVVVARKI